MNVIPPFPSVSGSAGDTPGTATQAMAIPGATILRTITTEGTIRTMVGAIMVGTIRTMVTTTVMGITVSEGASDRHGR